MDLKNIGDSLDTHVEMVIAPQVGKKDLCKLLGYVENAGVPSGVVPEFIGQKLFDTSGLDFYIAFGVASGNWSPLSINTLSATELAFLDGALTTNLVASKAAILGTGGALTIGGDFTMPDNGYFSFSSAAVAAVGNSQATYAVLADQVNSVTGADNTTGVALPAAAAGKAIYVLNSVQDKALKVAPVNAGNDAINSLTAGTGVYTLGAGRGAWFIPISAIQWYVDRDTEQKVAENNGGVAIDQTVTKKVNITAANLAAAAKVDILTPASVTEQWCVENVVLVGGGTNFNADGDRLVSLTDGITVYTTIANTDIETAPSVSLPFGNAKVPYLTGTIGTLTAAGAQIYLQYSGGATDASTGGGIDFFVTLRKAVN